MARYRLSHKAEADIEGIALYSVERFGLATAQDYLDGLHRRFELLGDHPSWGNDYSFIAPGLQRYEHRSHAIYYIANPPGMPGPEADILIVRVLGSAQDPARHM